ncbi:MAG: glycosyltransferase family 4 protein [Deltaproteobacteria bacterium]|nr:glycosyltransferase family 4 protein [Deltaproteobacteria bacterium]
MIRVGIDASNIKRGGGVTHLRELLNAAHPHAHGIQRVTVWTNEATAATLPNKTWLQVAPVPALNKSLLHQLRWQRFHLPKLAKEECDILFVPGGNNPGRFHPFVTMSQNILPFDRVERARYGLSWMRFRLLLLRMGQARTFRWADGMIFLTATAKKTVEQATGPLSNSKVIPHGINPMFRMPPRAQAHLDGNNGTRLFRWLYVSIVDVYKHQWNVAAGVQQLLDEGLPVEVEFIGPAYAPALARLQGQLSRNKALNSAVHYRGPMAHESLVDAYRAADGFVFASSCENMPIILMEAMAAGLPIACSNRGPMPEVLRDAGVYFDPESPWDIARAMKELMLDREMRAEWAARAYEYAKEYTWDGCARETFSFLAEVAAMSGACRSKAAKRCAA